MGNRLLRSFNWLPSSRMFRFGGPPKSPLLDHNPLGTHFELGRLLTAAGPELIWKIYEGTRRNDGKDVSIFIFEKKLAEKLHKPKRKETITEILRSSIRQLERFRHPKILQILGSDECTETLAFATEPILGSLANFLERGFEFTEVELKYGLLQITEALQFLHYSGRVLHRNVCPLSIFITKRSTWKLAGLEFTERLGELDPLDPIACQPWTSRLPKMAQHDLDFAAPEIQTGQCSVLSDLYSLGMVIGAIFNQGRPLVCSNHSTSIYIKQIEQLDTAISTIIPRVPTGLHEALVRLLNREPRNRPTSQLLALIKYFSDPTIQALQFLDVISMKDPSQKAHFYKNCLKEVMPYLPRKLWFQHIWPCLQAEMKTAEVLAAVLTPIIFLIQESSYLEYDTIILPSFKFVFTVPTKSIQATVTLLENLDVVLEKSREENVAEILNTLYTGFDSGTLQVQNAALISATLCHKWIEEVPARKIILPKTKLIYEQHAGDLKVVINVLRCLEKMLDKLERSQIIEEVLCILYDMNLKDPDVNELVVRIYKVLLSDKKFGLSVNLMATRVMPSLVPQTINPSLNLEQFSNLLEILQEMLDSIERNQRNVRKLDHLSPSLKLRHQRSTDQICTNYIKIDRKTSSAEDVVNQRKNSVGYSDSFPGGESNFLRVNQTIRRLSDNTLMPPKIRVAGPQELPTRRHSSIGQERRVSTAAVNLSPPSLRTTNLGGSMPNSRGSFLGGSSGSIAGLLSRRSSTALGQTGLLSNLQSGVVRNLRVIVMRTQ